MVNSYQVEFTQTAKKQLSKLPKTAQLQIIKVIKRARIRPHSYVKKLVGNKFFRLRAGDYRIIIDIQKGKLIILVLEIGHRKKIYK